LECSFLSINDIEEKKLVRIRKMGDFNTEAFTLLGLAIVIIGLRTTARWIMVGPKNFQADDYLMLVACVSLVVYCNTAIEHCHPLITTCIGGVWT
jgi:uncharacterized membrane protein